MDVKRPPVDYRILGKERRKEIQKWVNAAGRENSLMEWDVVNQIDTDKGARIVLHVPPDTYGFLKHVQRDVQKLLNHADAMDDLLERVKSKEAQHE